MKEIKGNYNIQIMIIVEPRVSGNKADKIISKLGFSSNFITEAEGFSGGIWLLWDGNGVSVDVINTSRQCIHCKVPYSEDKESFFLSCIYGSPIPSVRHDLCMTLASFNKSVENEKWFCIGDFNAYRKLEDKQGGARPNIKTMSDFNKCCTDCNLMKLNWCGPRFTWKNGRIQERIDWALANFNGFEYFTEALVEHLNWFKLDHRPVLLRLGGRNKERNSSKRFKFMATWTTEKSFRDLVRINWRNDVDLPNAISSLTGKILEWNNTVFGNIHKRKRDLTKRLNGIDKANPRGTNSFLNQLQETLWKDYEKILLQEELLWCQRARHRWLQFGDRNTKFFHASTMVRKKRNKIEVLKNEFDEIVSDKNEIKGMVTNFFKALYSKEDQGDDNTFPLRGMFPKLDHSWQESLDADVTFDEIKDALFIMGALKAPGLDGFHAMFYQSQWETIEASLYRFIKKCFQDPSLIDSINDTDVVLIPIIENPNSLRQFRPIALCNVIYKIITKVIANRLKPYMGDLISPTQCSFVSGRHSSDNVIIAQEIVHSMTNKRGKKGFMAIKVDLEKAYDRLS